MSAPTATKAQRASADYTLGTPHARSSVTSAELLEIPADCIGKFVRFQSTAGSGAAVDIGIRFGDSGAACVIGDRSSLSVAALTADVNVPHLYLVAGQSERIRLDPSWTHLSHISGATTGCLRFAPAEGSGV